MLGSTGGGRKTEGDAGVHPLSGYDLKRIPYLWEPPRCEAHTATRVVLGNLGPMSDVTRRLPDPS